MKVEEPLTIVDGKVTPVLLSIDTASLVLSISRPELERYIRRGELPTFKVGRRVYIEAANIPPFVQHLKAISEAAA